ncbi:hypothetical protein EIN_518220 [Entamoeba invadens IP1]|uniref:Leucine rich repeat containing protein BspA family protein n=1 Tax=Entamoeba invadens IP1 TaxID=370355 RepID=L7FKU8_ENTIV|nr:hypothetical protein EIN_518220 [Entamoeba invadens IP1]ELP85469.1 hypothetical protein EIN_518220 [Entamoeba invadens IP1]|eukprot:XP_004184815.1 hypothetical protein EIN_518220 [Entamoeba invadens IP1]
MIHLNSNELVEIVKYITSTVDVTKFMFISKKVREILKTYTYNPFPITPQIFFDVFPHIKEINIWNKEDCNFFIDYEIFEAFQNVEFNLLFQVDFKTATEIREYLGNNFQFKKVCFTSNDVKEFGYKFDQFQQNITITIINDLCFEYRTSLGEINLPKSLIRLGKACFSNCIGLTELYLPQHIICIDNNCFYNCSNLISISIPSEVTCIGESCFENCSSLKRVQFNRLIKLFSLYRLLRNISIEKL